MKQPFALLSAALLCVACAACGRHPLDSAGTERNRLFAEIVKREDLRILGNDDFFATHLRDASQTKVQEWCAMALGRIGDPRSLPWLYEALRASHATVRAAAAFAVGEAEDRDLLRSEGRGADARAIAELTMLLGDQSVLVQMRAIEALGKIGRDVDALRIIKSLDGVSYDGSPQQRIFLCTAITALMRLKNPAARPSLERLAATEDPEIQWRVANAFFRMRDQEALPVLRRLLQSGDANVRAHTARALGICGDPSLAALLMPLLPPVDRHSGIAIPLAVRVCALQALGNMKSPLPVASITAALEAAPISPANPDQYNFATQAAATLGNIGSEEAISVLEKLVFIPGPVADSAVVALARLNSGKPDRFFALVSAAQSDSLPSRRAWAAALGEVGGDRARRELKNMLLRAADERAGPSERLAVPAVLQALAQAGEPDLPLILPTYLASHDNVVKRAAVAAFRPPSSVATPWRPFLHIYAQISEETDAETKVAILTALEPWTQRLEVQSLLRSALQDRARTARVAAARLLRTAGVPDVPAELGPESTRATDVTYGLAAGSRQDRTLAIMETTRGRMEIELFREDAPMTVANFVSLANRGFFDGLAFMRVVPFFVIQGGDPRNDQEGGPGYTIRCEINMRPFERGAIGMALAGKDTGGSQFFITLAPQPHLDGGYTCFGRVISGMSAADRMVAGDRIIKVRTQDEISFFNYRRY